MNPAQVSIFLEERLLKRWTSDSSSDSGLVCFTVLGGLGVDTELGVEAGEEHGVAREAVLHPPSLNVSG